MKKTQLKRRRSGLATATCSAFLLLCIVLAPSILAVIFLIAMPLLATVFGLEIGILAADQRIRDEKELQEAKGASLTIPYLTLRHFLALLWNLPRIALSEKLVADLKASSGNRSLGEILSTHLLRLLGNFLLPRSKELSMYRKSLC